MAFTQEDPSGLLANIVTWLDEHPEHQPDVIFLCRICAKELPIHVTRLNSKPLLTDHWLGDNEQCILHNPEWLSVAHAPHKKREDSASATQENSASATQERESL